MLGAHHLGWNTFKKCVKKEKLECKKVYVLDAPTRCNLSYIMLDTVLKLRKAFDRMAEEEEIKYLSYYDEKGKEDENIQVEQVQSPKEEGRTTNKRRLG